MLHRTRLNEHLSVSALALCRNLMVWPTPTESHKKPIITIVACCSGTHVPTSCRFNVIIPRASVCPLGRLRTGAKQNLLIMSCMACFADLHVCFALKSSAVLRHNRKHNGKLGDQDSNLPARHGHWKHLPAHVNSCFFLQAAALHVHMTGSIIAMQPMTQPCKSGQITCYCQCPSKSRESSC